jgi:hypothetical protein
LYTFESYFSTELKFTLDLGSNLADDFGSNFIEVIDNFGSNLNEFELSFIELKLVPLEFESGCLYKNLMFLKVDEKENQP